MPAKRYASFVRIFRRFIGRVRARSGAFARAYLISTLSSKSPAVISFGEVTPMITV